MHSNNNHTKMKAVIRTEYGAPDVLRVAELDKPTPQANEILVRIHANSVNYGDITARDFRSLFPHRFNMPAPLYLIARLSFGWRKPRNHILGSEYAGEVVAVGAAVTRFKPGDQVFGYRGQNMQANAEYLAVAEDSVVTHKPANMTYEEAAVVPYGMLTALNLLKKVNIQPGQKVLIIGASGGIGAAAVQLARHYGAEVTGVAGTRRLEFVKALGAEKVIDYTREDFTRSGETYDLIFDILGKSSFRQVKKSLTARGIYLRASFKMREVFQMLWTSLFDGRKVVVALAIEKPDDLVFIRDLVEAGKVKSVIDRAYPMEQAAEAHRYVENGQKQGQVVLRLA